jgi:peptide/nickel transport system substrate-binding protein
VGDDELSLKPIGSGPYELVDFRSADLAHFRKRTTEHPFRKSQPSELVFRSITEQTQMINGLRTGELDVLIGQISPDRLETLRPQEAVILSRLGGVSSGLFSQVENQQRGTPLVDKRVRLALNYAVDKETIARTIFRGYAQPTGQLSVPDSPSWDPNVQPIPYDVAMAKRLLAEAGYPNGFKLPAGLDYSTGRGEQNYLVAVQADLKAVGVDCQIKTFEWGSFLEQGVVPPDKNPEWDLMAFSWIGDNGDPDNHLYILLSGDQWPPNGFNCGYYKNEKVDELLRLGRTTLDRAKRTEIYQQAQKLIVADAPWIWIDHETQIVVMDKRIQNFKLHPTGPFRFADVWIEQ